MCALKKENYDVVIPDAVVKIHELWGFIEFQDAITTTFRATLNTIVVCPVCMPVEQRISVFHYCKEVISILKN